MKSAKHFSSHWLGASLISVALMALAEWTWYARWWQPQSPVDRALQTLADAARARRFVAARLSSPFVAGPPLELTRGADGERSSYGVELAVLNLQVVASHEHTAASRRAVGIASLARHEVDRAIASLDEAVRLDPALAAAHVDLSAALIERWERDREPSLH